LARGAPEGINDELGGPPAASWGYGIGGSAGTLHYRCMRRAPHRAGARTIKPVALAIDFRIALPGVVRVYVADAQVPL
jgi:hypothetical protein